MSGRWPPSTSATTARPRLGRMTWTTTSSFRNTQSQQVRPSTRTVLSSEQTTRARRRRAGEGGGPVLEPRLGAAEQAVQGPLADRQREQVQEQPGQPPVADGVGEAQVERQRQDRDAEGRALLHPLRDRRQGGPAAARAAAEVALDP